MGHDSMKRSTFLSRSIACVAVAGLVTGAAQAQDCPQRAFTLVAPFGTGNIVDNQGRMIARQLALSDAAFPSFAEFEFPRWHEIVKAGGADAR
jgi:hypothetical protein